MVTAAQLLPDSVLAMLSKHKIENTYIHENKYFLGRNAERGMRLSEETMLKAIEHLAEDLAAKKRMSAHHFATYDCMLWKNAEGWIAKYKSKYASVWAECPAGPRVAEFLFSSRARPALAACHEQKIPLEGTTPDNGIENCRVLVAELDRLVAARVKASQEAAKATAAAAAAQAAAATASLSR